MTTMTIIAWTLLHFLWQGTAIAIALRLALALLRSNTAGIRYGASVVALGLVILAPLITAARLTQGASPGALPSQPVQTSDLRVAQLGQTVGDAAALQRATKQVIGTGGALPPLRAAVQHDGSDTPWRAAIIPLQRWGDAAAPFLVVAWLSGVLLLSIRFLGGWLQVRRLTRTAVSPASAEIAARMLQLAERIGVTRSVQLLTSAFIHVPTVVGWVRPILLMPLSLETGLTPSEVELLMAHELAHIRRHDYLVNLLQTVVETVLFYHPGVWWISDQIRQEREHCCDDLAISLFADRSAYARALLRLEEIRQVPPLLAVAANGGSLLRRVRRLIAAPARHAEGRGRWAAIPLGVAAVVGIVNGTTFAGSAVAPTTVIESSAASAMVADTVRSTAARNAKPDTVIRYEGAATSLSQRWDWATAAARRAGRKDYWIGYAISGDPSRGMVYMDRHVPVYTRGGTTMGNMRFKDGGSGMSFIGARMDSLVGLYAPDEQVVLYGFVTRNGRVELDRMHASTFALPVHFSGRSLVWLGAAGDQESIDVARRLYAATPGPELKGDLVQVVGLHADDAPVLAALRSWLESNESDDMRANAAEELGARPTPAALALAARTARTDRSRRVRREAAEALGETTLPQATDTLIALAHSGDDTEVRREAIETLGERHDARAYDALVKMAWENLTTELQREAVETLGETEEDKALADLERIARTHPKDEVRREAVETMGELDRPAEVLPILRSVIDKDDSHDVRRTAVGAIGESKDARAFAELSELAKTHRDSDVRRAAVEALTDQGEKEAVIDILGELIEGGTGEADQVAAVEALGNLEDKRAIEMLERTASSHPSSRLRRAAVETLGSAAPHEQALAILNRIIWSGSSEEVAKTAVEALGSIEHSGVVAEFAKIASEHPLMRVRHTAIEQLGDLDGGPEARETLARLGRRDGDIEIRKAAIEAYANRASPAEIVSFMSDLVKNDRSYEVQVQALEALGDMERHEGTPAVIQVARTHPNPEIRKRAIEMLGDSDDPRAHAELARLLQSPSKSR